MNDEICRIIIQNIHRELKKYIIKGNLKALVIGESGGIDSGICSALARPVCDELNIPLIGVSIPIETNKIEEITRANAIGDFYCHKFHEADLTEAYFTLCPNIIQSEEKNVNPDHSHKIRLGNIKARLRMIYLMHIASLNRGMVLSTDNFTEYLLGFWTLHGDAGDYGMIQYLFKTEVYILARYLVSQFNNNGDQQKADALAACIVAVPTDGLGITNSDLDQIQAATYEEVDNILNAFQDGDTSLKSHPVIQRYLNSYYKRENPFNLARKALLKGVEDRTLLTRFIDRWKHEM